MLNMKNGYRKYPLQEICTDSDLDKASSHPTGSVALLQAPATITHSDIV